MRKTWSSPLPTTEMSWPRTSSTPTRRACLKEQIQDVQEHIPSIDENAYIIQGQDDYKIQLLQAVMDKDSMERWADLAVFCRDGMAWSSQARSPPQ